MGVILGLDPSLTASGVVAVPLDWAGDFSQVESMVIGRKLTRTATEAERVDRLLHIAEGIVSFARKHRARSAWLESYAFSQAKAAHSLGELGGVLRVELHRAGIDLHVAPMGPARALLLGRVPRKGAKVACAEALKAAGADFPTLDEFDAMVVANYGLSELGRLALVQAA